jgi:hypothetical protein
MGPPLMVVVVIVTLGVVTVVLKQWNTHFQEKDRISVDLCGLGFMGELYIHKPLSSEVEAI